MDTFKYGISFGFQNSPWAHLNTFGVILLIGRGEDRPKVT